MSSRHQESRAVEVANAANEQAPTQVVENNKKTKPVIDFTQGIKEMFCLLSPTFVFSWWLAPCECSSNALTTVLFWVFLLQIILLLH